MINLQDGGKYYGKYLVTKINYHNSTIGVVDPGLVKKHNCWISSPLHSNIAAYYTHYVATRPYYLPDYEWAIAYPSSPFKPIFYTIVLMKCEELVSHYDYIPIIPISFFYQEAGYCVLLVRLSNSKLFFFFFFFFL